MSDLKHRQEGVRIKHSVNGNSLKLYDKAFTVAGSVLRAEATVHNGGDFRVYRPKEGDPDGEMAWRQMRRGVADLHRRAEVSRKAAERYLDAFASVDEDTTLEELIRRLGQSKQWRGRRVRALRPFADDSALRGSRQPRRVRDQRIPEPGSASHLLSPRCQEPAGNPKPLGLGEPEASSAARSRADYQSDRHTPLPSDTHWAQSRDRDSHGAAIHRPSTDSGGGMKIFAGEKGSTG